MYASQYDVQPRTTTRKKDQLPSESEELESWIMLDPVISAAASKFGNPQAIYFCGFVLRWSGLVLWFGPVVRFELIQNLRFENFRIF